MCAVAHIVLTVDITGGMKHEMHNITTDRHTFTTDVDSGINSEYKPVSKKICTNERRPVLGKSYDWKQSVETAPDGMNWFRCYI
jgi:hypothetical protein